MVLHVHTSRGGADDTFCMIAKIMYVTVVSGSDGAKVGVYTRCGTVSFCLAFLFLHRENEGMGALGTELSSEALTLRVFRVSKNRETMRDNSHRPPSDSI